jgi:serine phosphatase RsbU (regulator of sigma subunit)
MHLRLLTLFFILGNFHTLFAQNKVLDSLQSLLPTQKDTAKVNLLINISWKARNINPLLTIEVTRQAVKIARDTLKRPDLESRAWNYMGVGYRNIGNYHQALECFFKGITLSEVSKDYESLAYNLQSIGDIYNKKGNYDKAIPYIEKGKEAFEKINNLEGIGYCHYTLGQVYHNQKAFAKAIESYGHAIEIRKKIKDDDGLATVINRLGMVYKGIKDYPNALQYHQEALQVYEKLDSKRNIVWANLCIAQVYKVTNNYDEAIELLEKYLPLAKKIQAKDHIKDMYQELMDCHEALKDYTNAHKATQLFIAYKDSALASSTLQEIEYLQMAYDKEKREREVEELKNVQKSKQFWYFWWIGGILLALSFVLLLVFFLVRGNQKQRRANAILEGKNQEIHLKNEYISSSISYAKTIQDAILPAPDLMRSVFPEYFVLNVPKDVVSGDFYWLRQVGEGYILVGADCTGHGVAGAFMTLIGSTLLDKIVETEKIYSPQEILNLLHLEISSLLNQDTTGDMNGMDAVVLYFLPTKEGMQVTFCGAKNSLYYTVGKTTQIQKLAGTRKGIGGMQNGQTHFSNQTITLPEGSMLYFGSDGLPDQNDLKRKRLGEHGLIQILQDIATLPAQEQHQKLLEKLKQHKEGTFQRDDILWIGIRMV